MRTAILMEVVSQQGKEIIKTALRCLLREAVTLKWRGDKIARLARSELPWLLAVRNRSDLELVELQPPALLEDGHHCQYWGTEHGVWGRGSRDLRVSSLGSSRIPAILEGEARPPSHLAMPSVELHVKGTIKAGMGLGTPVRAYRSLCIRTQVQAPCSHQQGSGEEEL